MTNSRMRFAAAILFAATLAPAMFATPGSDVHLVRIVNGSVIVYSDGGDAAGYAKVRVGGRDLTLSLVSVVPYGEMRNGKLDGYRVGEYQAVPLKGLQQYERPKGFIRLGDANDDLLEILQHELATRHGLTFDRFTIMSGYRTPYYNAKIGNETEYSRHLYGDAMDVYIDQNGDGKMDDVNRDGRVDTSDARFLLRVAEQIDNSDQWGWLKGGAGVYDANAAHGPYLHVDARGYVARWGATEAAR